MTKPPIQVSALEIKTPRLILQPIITVTEVLVDAVIDYAGNEEAVKFITIPVQTEQQVREYLAGVVEENSKPTSNLCLAICLANGTPMGLIDLRFKKDNLADFAYAISPEFWGKGYVSEAVKCLTDWAFKTTQVQTLQIRVYEGNGASAKVATKNGFAETSRHSEVVKYVEVTVLVHTLTRSDWFKLQP